MVAGSFQPSKNGPAHRSSVTWDHAPWVAAGYFTRVAFKRQQLVVAYAFQFAAFIFGNYFPGENF